MERAEYERKRRVDMWEVLLRVKFRPMADWEASGVEPQMPYRPGMEIGWPPATEAYIAAGDVDPDNDYFGDEWFVIDPANPELVYTADGNLRWERREDI